MTTRVKAKENTIAAAMLKAGLSVRGLAAKAGISPTQAGDLRLEKIGLTLPHATRVAEALGQPVTELFEHNNGDQIQNLI